MPFQPYNQTPKFSHRRTESKENYEAPDMVEKALAQKQSSGLAFIWGSGKDGRCGNGKQASE